MFLHFYFAKDRVTGGHAWPIKTGPHWLMYMLTSMGTGHDKLWFNEKDMRWRIDTVCTSGILPGCPDMVFPKLRRA